MLTSFIAAAACVASLTSQQQPPRDAHPVARDGTATISGAVISDEPSPKPLRRARVMLNGPALRVGRTVIAGDDGIFVFDRLTAGRYTIGAAKEGYVQMNFGAARTGRPGTPVVVHDGEARTLTLRIPRGSVVTGTVVDADGRPASGVPVTAMARRWLPPANERLLLPALALVSLTDDRGVYRIYGLPKGTYVIAANARSTGPSASTEFQTISEVEVRRALAEVRGAPSRSTEPVPLAGSASDGLPDRPRGVRIAPTYYPGTSDLATATTLALASGEERSGVDFQLQYVPTATVSGTVVAPDGSEKYVVVQLIRLSEATSADGFRSTHANGGTFTFARITPGRYMAIASGVIGTTVRSAPPVRNASALWATAEVAVDGEDVTNVALVLQPGLTLSGRLAFEGSGGPASLPALRVPLPVSLAFSGTALPVPPLQLAADGTFSVQGIIPGTYRLGSNIPGLRAPVGGWWLKSIVANGQELLDRPLELRNSVNDAVATFSDRASELSGKVADATGASVADYFVVAFPVDKASWFLNSRRIAGIRPGNDGAYSIRNLPAGDYLVAVTNELEQGEWFDASALETLVASAARITLGEHEKTTHDVTVK